MKLLFVGNGFFRKGGDIVIKAFQQLKAKYNISLTLVSNFQGEIHYHQPKSYSSYIKDISTKDERIKWLCNVDRETILNKIYPEHDIFLTPTNADLCPLSIIEAMHSKMPIISTKIGAIPEMVENGVNGFLLESPVNNYRPSWNEEQRENIKNALVEKLSLLMYNPSLMREMGEKSFEIARTKFSHEVRNEKLKKVYLEAIK